VQAAYTELRSAYLLAFQQRADRERVEEIPAFIPQRSSLPDLVGQTGGAFERRLFIPVASLRRVCQDLSR
jgi:hypothetical protein